MAGKKSLRRRLSSTVGPKTREQPMGLAFLIIHFSAVIFVLKMSVKRSANIHLWGALASCWGLFIIPYFMLVTSRKQSEVLLFKKVQNCTTLIYAHGGASIGVFMGLVNLFINIISDKSDAFLGALFFYFPTFILGLPWSLVSIFSIDYKFKLTLIVFSTILNGVFMGIAYDRIGNYKTVNELAMNCISTK